jgi:hypothetical protein
MIWRQLRHPSLLPFIGVDKEAFASAGFLSIVSPWMERGTLRDYVKSAEYEPARDLHRTVRHILSELDPRIDLGTACRGCRRPRLPSLSGSSTWRHQRSVGVSLHFMKSITYEALGEYTIE